MARVAGANLTHGLGLLVFGALPLAVALHDYALVAGVPGLRPLTIAVAAAYSVIAWRFWLLRAAAVTTSGLACFVAAAVL